MLLKGINKRVIIIKNPESEIFEEAYFIIKSGNIKGVIKQSKENEMVTEANRIITDYHNQQVSIIEKNGIASSIGGDISELDNFLSGKKENKNIVNNTEKSNKKSKKNEKVEKFENTENKSEINQPLSHLSDNEIFEDEKFLENIQNEPEKYGMFYKNPDFMIYSEEVKPYKSSFDFVSSKKTCNPVKNMSLFMRLPPKSFFIGVGFMSLVVILIRLFEFVFLH